MVMKFFLMATLAFGAWIGHSDAASAQDFDQCFKRRANGPGAVFYRCESVQIRSVFYGTLEECRRPGHRLIEEVGFLSATRRNHRSIALYRCHWRNPWSHWVSDDSRCDGGYTDYFMGYCNLGRDR